MREKWVTSMTKDVAARIPTVESFGAIMSKMWHQINKGDELLLLTLNKISALQIVRK